MVAIAREEAVVVHEVEKWTQKELSRKLRWPVDGRKQNT
jgi:hypothetical protein